ncbi:MAG: DUF3473 domain-containing protein [Nitrospirales bacterium]|nr:DUF3473 domain-containing protein [Nitrospira sp.]MDR4501888.1 DUF3473 domain-containing protein [Nitrospirales bacterium]
MIHSLSFDIEEHFQVAAFDCPARRRHWDVLHSRVEQSTETILSLLEAVNVQATMFILGWVAERHGGLVKRLANAGHEIACHGYSHELIAAQSPAKFREDIRTAKKILEDLTGKAVLGYRAPTFSITKETKWALPILVEEGYLYDSSIVPAVHDSYGIPDASPDIHSLATSSGVLWEVPPSTYKIGWMRVPIGGGGYFRLLPYRLFKWFLTQVENEGMPLVMYFHPWELDPDQPKMKGSLLSGFRHYVNLQKTQRRLAALLQDFQFAPICTALPSFPSLIGEDSNHSQTHQAIDSLTNPSCSGNSAISHFQK